MASVRRTLTTICILIVVAILAAGGVIGYSAYERWSIGRQLTDIRQLLTDGKTQEAETQLAGLAAKIKPGQPMLADWLDLRLQALESLNDLEKAGQLAVQALNPEKPWVEQGNDAWVRAHLLLGRREIAQEHLEAARSHFDLLAKLPAESFGHTEGQFGLGIADLATPGQVQAGHDRLAALLDTMPEDHPLRPDVEKALGSANMFLLMSPEIHEGDEFYVIKKGDTLDGLRRRYKVSSDLLMGVNQITNVQNLSIGRRIKIPRLELSILVNKSDNTLILMNRGKFFKKYNVRTGQYEQLTPVGDFAIQRKVANPPWTDPKTGQRYEGGDPNNQLGSRWMEISGQIGIHEAIDPSTVGTYSSNGCVGLARPDVEELYNLVSVGTPVRIVGKRGATGALSASELAAPAQRRPAMAPQSTPATSLQRSPSAAPALPSSVSQATPAAEPTRAPAARSRNSRSRNTSQEGRTRR
ncbi:L,D-transpeptidase family protein [bacterium]|nr:L,D-transpeptidase family protein [bacterium]